jgi:flagellar hook-basal body complex protein FliE
MIRRISIIEGIAQQAAPCRRSPTPSPAMPDIAARFRRHVFPRRAGGAPATMVDTLKRRAGRQSTRCQRQRPTREVVDAVMSAEQSLQAAIAIRDKIVIRLSRISRMAI